MQVGKINLVKYRELVDARRHHDACQPAIIEELHKKIRGTFSSGGSTASFYCRQLTTELIYSHVIYGEALEPYLSIVEYLRDALRNSSNEIGDVIGDWATAVGYAVEHYAIDPKGYHGNDWTRVYTREFQVASAAKFLNEIGYRIVLTENKIKLIEESEKKLVTDLENMIQKMGGINLARKIFSELQNYYDIAQERYHVGRRTSTSGGGSAQVPFAYLLNLSVKHPLGKKPYKNDQVTWERIKALSACYAALFDVQDYYPNIFPLIPMEIPNHLRRLALHDSLFFVNQFRGRDVVPLLEGILSDIDRNQKFGDGWTIDEVLKVTSVIMAMSTGVRGPMIISTKSVLKSCPNLSRLEVDRVLKSVLSHSPSGANQKFSRPTDIPTKDDDGKVTGGVDFFTRPLLRFGESSYFLLDRGVCGTGFIEAIFEKLRSEVDRFDEIRGMLIENYLINEFRSRGVSVISGAYSVENTSGDCDLVVETDKEVIFLEIKKKGLTRLSKAGSPAHILIDLAASLIDALLQAGKHEIAIRQHDSIDLEKNGKKEALELNGRDVEKIVVTLLDFGGFQDRVIMKQFLEATTQVNYNVDGEDLKGKIIELNSKIEKLKKQTAGLNELKGSDHQPYFECWFLSIPQILILLDNVCDSNGFRDRLWKIRHVFRGSQDFYFEFSEASKY